MRWESAAVPVPESSALLRPWPSVSRVTVPVFDQEVSPWSLKPGSSTGVPWPHRGSAAFGACFG